MADVVLRVKYKSDSHTIKSLKSDSTWDDLKEAIVQISSLRKNCFRILGGFPPKPKNSSNPKQTLQDLEIKSGDTLIVEMLSVADHLKRNFKNPESSPPLCDSLGIFMKKVVPADNSCLFTSVYFIISEGVFDASCAKAMRKIIAEAVRSDRDTYSEAFLGKSNKDYRRWITNDDSWGGAIELFILSSWFGLELDVVDAQTGRIDRFGEDHQYPCHGFLLYSGIHYDPLMFEETKTCITNNEACPPQSSIQTIFSSSDEYILQMAMELGVEAKQSKQYTDVQHFTLCCLICKKALNGQDEAMKHANETGHTQFGEVS